MNKKFLKLFTTSLVVGSLSVGFQFANYKNSAEISNIFFEKTFAAEISESQVEREAVPSIERAIQFALDIAADNTHGYSQGAENATKKNPYTGSREGALPESKRPENWTPDFDCSSLIYWSLEKGGFKIIEQWQNNNPKFWNSYNGKQYTGDANTVWQDLEPLGGWEKYSWNEMKNDLKRGDIIYRKGHIAFYIGNGQTVEARGVNNPKGKGSYKTGDQGGEIDIYQPYDRNWLEVYRYVRK